MFWQTVCVDRILCKHEMFEVLSQIFNVQRDEIFISAEMPKVNLEPHIRIICQTFLAKNMEFPFRIEIYLRDRMLSPQNDIALLSGFCKLLKCRSIISDESADPYAWLVLDDNFNVDNIFIKNIEEYDHVEEYEVN